MSPILNFSQNFQDADTTEFRTASDGYYEGVLVNEAGLIDALSDVTQFIEAGDEITLLDGTTAWRLPYINGASNVIELALGSDGEFLMSNGASAAPTFETAVTDTSHKVAYNDVLGLGDTISDKTIDPTI